jgi:hypothetical protein
MTSVKTTQTFDLSEEDVQTAVAEFIEKRFGPGGDPKVSVRTRRQCALTAPFMMSSPHTGHGSTVSAPRTVSSVRTGIFP